MPSVQDDALATIHQQPHKLSYARIFCDSSRLLKPVGELPPEICIFCPWLGYSPRVSIAIANSSTTRLLLTRSNWAAQGQRPPSAVHLRQLASSGSPDLTACYGVSISPLFTACRHPEGNRILDHSNGYLLVVSRESHQDLGKSFSDRSSSPGAIASNTE